MHATERRQESHREVFEEDMTEEIKLLGKWAMHRETFTVS
jgi:hypothetical protein